MAGNQTPYSTESEDQDGPSEERHVEASKPNPPIMIQVLGQEIDLGTLEMNTMVKDLGHVAMDFSALSMYEVHSIQNVTVIGMRNIEHAFINQVKY